MNKNILLVILFYFILTPFLSAQIQVGQPIYGIQEIDFAGSAVAVSADGTIVAVGAKAADGVEEGSGQVRIYQYNGFSWNQLGQSIEGEGAHDNSGAQVSLSADGTIVAIGSYLNDGGLISCDIGHVRVFLYDGINWIQLGQDLDGTSCDDSAGSVSLSSDGNIVAVGAAGGNSILDSGYVQVYQFNGTYWVQLGQDIDGEAEDDVSGAAISISDDGNIIAIGAPGNSGSLYKAGHVRVYQFDGTNWTQLGQDIDGEASGDASGRSVSLSSDGSIVAIGATGNATQGNNTGHVRVYQYNGTSWIQKGKDIDGEDAGNYFGVAISISDDGSIMAVGEIGYVDGNNYGAGRVRMFKFDGSDWLQLGAGIVGDGSSGFSVSVSAEGSIVAIGAPYNSTAIYGGGAVHVYSMEGVYGKVYLDINEDCIQDSIETGLNKRYVTIQPGNIILETQEDGSWSAGKLSAGTYTLTVDTTGYWTTNCPVYQSFTVTNPDSITIAPSFGLITTNPCTDPAISIQMPFMRRCFSNQKVYVQACNSYLTTTTLDSAYVVLDLDDLFAANDFELPYTYLGNNQYAIVLGDLEPGQCVDFWVETTLSCDAELGQGLCVQAELFPAAFCVFDTIPNPFPPTVDSCSTAWDNSSLSVIGYCQNDTVYFDITNTGEVGNGDMTCFSPVTVYVDGVLILVDSVQLLGQETVTYTFPANGESWHLEVAQHPLHPGNSNPRATVENCGGSTGQSRINLFAQDDADPIIDIYCNEVTGSYDPNDKTGYPLGVSEAHHIRANQQMQYVVRFQNTGTDTAFTVVIRDTITMDLDVFSVRPGVSSHDYDFKLYGPRVLEWTFNNIMLPDSNVNEAASHGFVSFTIDQVPNLPDGTVISNSAGIYFDFNDPIITNTTTHTIHYDLPVSLDIHSSFSIDQSLSCNGDSDGQISVFPLGGTAPFSYNWNNGMTTSSLNNLEAGSYTVSITDANGLSDVNTITLAEPPLLITALTNSLETSCNLCTGSADINVTGGTSPYSFTWSNGEVTEDATQLCEGNHSISIVDVNGCSTMLNITTENIGSPSSSALAITACDSYTSPSGNATWTDSGIYTDVITNTMGCDSTITLDLTLNKADTSILIQGASMTANAVNATYQWLDCDTNEPILGETAQTFIPTTNGSYALEITENGCTSTSECFSILILDLKELSLFDEVLIYPNPSKGLVNIDLGDLKEVSLKLFKVTGEIVYQKENINTSLYKLDFNLAKGMYFLELSTKGQQQRFKLVLF